MTFSPEWESMHASTDRYGGGSPALSTLVENFLGLPLRRQRVLELGCARGGFGHFIRRMNGEYCGIDGSATAIAATDLPSSMVACADFTKEIPFPGQFDLIVDRAAVAHNDTDSIRRCIDMVFDRLLPGGLFISVDWFSLRHSEADHGEMLDEHAHFPCCTRTRYPDGQFAGIGKVHFSGEAELALLFSSFERLLLNENFVRRPKPRPRPDGFLGEHRVGMRWISPRFDNEEYISATWNIVVRKPV